jgi:acyl dehydratase
MLAKLADFLEREGGAVASGFLLLGMGWGMWATHFPKGEDVVMVAVGAIAMAIKGRMNGHNVGAPPA